MPSFGGPSGFPTGLGCRQVQAEVPTAKGARCQMQMETQGRDLAPRQVPYQEGLRNSPPAGKDPSR
jgi:hypothetical protein